MSKLLSPTDGLIFVSILYRDKFQLDIFLGEWKSRYGDGIFIEPEFNPSFDYYSKEMGDNLKRLIFVSNNPIARESIVPAKIWATEYEVEQMQNDSRRINIDPGLLTLENMILSTGKPFAHRVYLGNGVYADLNYIFQKGSYQILPWTYPDYAHQEKLDFFAKCRKEFLMN